MRVRVGVFVSVAVCTALAVTGAQAAPSVPASALAAAQAMSPTPSLITSASYVLQPTSGGAAAPTVASSSDPVLGMPDHGSTYAVLSSGNAISDMAFTGTRTDGQYTNATGTDAHGWQSGDIDDLTVLKVTVNVPSGSNCLSFAFRFLSQEYPTYVGQYNDGLIVELDRNDWTSLSGGGFSAPGNFAFDGSGEPISINSTGSLGMSSAGAAGTGFASTTGSSYGGGTDLLTAATPITPGSHDLYFSVFDQGDHSYDTGALIDDLTTSQVSGGCTAGAVTPPAAPQAPVIASHPSSGPSATGIFSFTPASGDTTIASYECSIDGGTYGACISGTDFDTGLTDAAHTFSVRGVNGASVAGASTGPISWTKTTPVTPAPAAPTVTSAPPATTGSTSASIGFDGVPGATFTCSLDGASFIDCGSPVTFDGLTVGAHTLRVRQRDLGGQLSDAGTIAWQVTATRTAPPLSGPTSPDPATPPSTRPTAPISDIFLVRVRYRVPLTCTKGCRSRATLVLRTGTASTRLLGTRAGIALPHGRWATFTITVSRAALLAAHATTAAGMRTSLTRLTMTSVKADGTRVHTVHDGHITVSVTRLATGAAPPAGDVD